MNKKGSGILRISWRFLRYRLSAGHRLGHGIHSPFVYDLVRNILYNRAALQCPEAISDFHLGMMKNKGVLEIHDLGAGSRVENKKRRSISSMVRKSSVTPKLGALLYRICAWYKPSKVIEFGTGLGVSTAYLAAGAGKVPVISMEGSFEKHAFAKQVSPLLDVARVDYLHGDFNKKLNSLLEESADHMLVFIDGDHRYQSSLEKVNAFLQQRDLTEMMIILDDIYWSDGMVKAWKESIIHPRVAISLDLFAFGILIVRPGIEKQHFIVNF